MQDDGAGGGPAWIPSSFLPPATSFFIPNALLAPRGTFTRRNNFVVLSVWHRTTLLLLLQKKSRREGGESLLRLVGWWVGRGSGAVASGAFSKTFGGHPVAAALWDTSKVAAKHFKC